MENDKICITRKVSKIFDAHTFFKQIHNINNENIQIYFNNSFIYGYGNIYDVLLYDSKTCYKDIIVAFEFISKAKFSDEYGSIKEYTYKKYENIIDEFIDYKFDITTFRTFLINSLIPENYNESYALFAFNDPKTGNIVEYKIYISKDDKPIKINVTNGFYLIG